MCNLLTFIYKICLAYPQILLIFQERQCPLEPQCDHVAGFVLCWHSISVGSIERPTNLLTLKRLVRLLQVDVWETFNLEKKIKIPKSKLVKYGEINLVAYVKHKKFISNCGETENLKRKTGHIGILHTINRKAHISCIALWALSDEGLMLRSGRWTGKV